MAGKWNCRLDGSNIIAAALPCAECPSPELCQKAAKQIVIVDDDQLQLGELADFMALQGFIVHPHSTPDEAISFMKDNDFDVLLSDIEMPRMNGMQLAAWLNDWRAEIPVILISGSNILQHDLPDGWSFFRKPVDLTLIQQAIENC